MIRNYCMKLSNEERGALRKEFEKLTGLGVVENGEAFDAFCLGRKTAVGNGFAIVPIQPTKEMREACKVAGKVQVWTDMIAAVIGQEKVDDPCTCHDTGYQKCPHHGVSAIYRHHMNDGMYD